MNCLIFITLILTIAFSANAFRAAPTSRSLSLLSSSKRGVSPLRMASDAVPHGGKLVNTMLKNEVDKQMAMQSCDFAVELDERQLCDVELLMQGGFSPLDGYMNEDNYKSVVNDLKLTNDLIFGLPVVFDTNDVNVAPGKKLLLTYKMVPIATFDVTSKYTPKKELEAKNCYGTTSIEHPAVKMITEERGKWYCGGKITGLNVPIREFPCKSPEDVRKELPSGKDIVAFQCRNPIHRAHYELFTRYPLSLSVRPSEDLTYCTVNAEPLRIPSSAPAPSCLFTPRAVLRNQTTFPASSATKRTKCSRSR